MDMDKLKAEIVEDEGRRTHPYKDTEGIWTGGIGHNLEAHGASWQDIATWLKTGISDAVIDGWFAKDIQESIVCCRDIFKTFDTLPDNVQRTLVNLVFDVMYEIRDWHHLIAAIAAKDWQAAAMSIIDSKFAHQGPNRCARLAARMIADG